MLKINDKTFLNIQEAIQWLLDNNALPFQCTANYAANTEIGLGTIVNPTMAKVRIGSLIFFADSKVSTVTGITSNGFIVSDQYNDLVDDVVYVSNVELNASGHLIVTLSNGTQIDAGLVKQVASFSINGSQHLIATYNDGTTNDLGAIFSGSVVLSGSITAPAGSFSSTVQAPVLSGVGGLVVVNDNIQCFDSIVDDNGHNRFISGSGSSMPSLSAATVTYNRYSLSGSHLMLVLAFSIPSAVGELTLSANAEVNRYNLPQWIMDQIYNIEGTTGSGVISRATLQGYNGYGATVGSAADLFVYKENVGNFIKLISTGSQTIGAAGNDSYYRLCLDFLIE